jgi:hypothetical protein
MQNAGLIVDRNLMSAHYMSCMIELPPTFAVQCVDGQRWLVVAPDPHSLAAGRTFYRIRAVDFSDPKINSSTPGSEVGRDPALIY